MALFNGVEERIEVGMDYDGNLKRRVDKDRAASSKAYTYAAYGGAGYTFLSSPGTGKVARLLNVIITSKELTDVSLTLKDAATQKIASLAVPAAASAVGTTVVFNADDLRGYTFSTSIIGVLNGVHANDTEVSIAWWIDPQLTE